MRNHAIVWVGSLILMLWTIAFAPVQRTQEARVVESAREMIDQPIDAGWRAWMIPRANGIVRLQKPPLAYWLAGGSFKLFGVRDWAARLPFALCAWATVVLTYHIAVRELASVRAGTCAAALLIGSFLFHRHGRMAETDIVLTLLLTVAIDAIWRGFNLADRRSLAWFALSGIAIGSAAIAKGLPALFAIAFLATMILITQRWQIAGRWMISGAPVLAVLIGLPWWIYVWRLPQAEIYTREIGVLMDEPTHPGGFFVYFAYLFKATLPWSPVLILALIDAAAARWRRDLQAVATLSPLLAWCGAILVPLFFIANKQEHYLLPMMPPLAIIAAWWLDRADGAVVRLVVLIASIALALSAIALPIVSRSVRGDILNSDLLVTCVLLTIAAVVFIRRSAAGFGVACALTMSAVIGFWWPTIDTQSPRNVAAEIRELGAGPYCFYGENASLALAYNLRAIVPQFTNARELTEAMSRDRDLLVIVQTKSNRNAPEPIGCELVREIFMKDQKFEIYRSIQ